MENQGPSGQPSSGRGFYRGQQQQQWRGRRPYRGRGYAPRSISQIRSDSNLENAQQQSKIDELTQKDATYDPRKTQRNQPKKENPDVDAPKIKLDVDVTDWIEKERANIEIVLSDNFEMQIIDQHAKQLDWSTTVLQYADRTQVDTIKNHYKAYCETNLAYRLLLTLPKSIKREIADLMIQLTMDEPPRNTPLMAEMFSHIGKHKNEAYGNLRIEGQLLQARRRIVNAMALVSGERTAQEFRWRDGKSANDINWTKASVWNDSDSLAWLKRRAIDNYNEMRKVNYTIDDTDVLKALLGTSNRANRFRYSIPYIEMHLSDPVTGGQWYLSADTLEEVYQSTLGYEKRIRDHLMAIIIIMFIGSGFFATENRRFKDYYPEFSEDGSNGTRILGSYAGNTMYELLDFMGLQSYSKLLSNADLIYNYGCIVDSYKSIAEPTIRQIFKLVPISNSEFGDEAQMMSVTDANLYVNPRVESNFKIKDTAKIGAAAVFGYAAHIRTKVADYTVLKRNKRAILSEMLEKFCRKN